LFTDCPNSPVAPDGGVLVGVNVPPGEPNIPGSVPGSVATYECSSDYVAADGSTTTATCMTTGTWIGPTLTCLRSNRTSVLKIDCYLI